MHYFKTGITMHLVRTFKTVELFKSSSKRRNFSEWTDGKKTKKKKRKKKRRGEKGGMFKIKFGNWHI